MTFQNEFENDIENDIVNNIENDIENDISKINNERFQTLSSTKSIPHFTQPFLIRFSTQISPSSQPNSLISNKIDNSLCIQKR